MRNIIWTAIISEIGANKKPYDHEVVYFAIWAIIQSGNFFKQWLGLGQTTPSLAPDLNAKGPNPQERKKGKHSTVAMEIRPSPWNTSNPKPSLMKSMISIWVLRTSLRMRLDFKQRQEVKSPQKEEKEKIKFPLAFHAAGKKADIRE